VAVIDSGRGESLAQASLREPGLAADRVEADVGHGSHASSDQLGDEVLDDAPLVSDQTIP
jgi:hypothetical protein